MKRIALLVACVSLLAVSNGCCCLSRPFAGGGACSPCGGYGAGYAPAGCPNGACGAAGGAGYYGTSYGGYQGAYAAPYGAPMTAALPPDYVVQ